MPQLVDYLAYTDDETLIRGDDWDWQFTFVDSDSNPMDITNWVIWFTQKTNLGDADPGVFQHSQAITALESDPTNGVANFNVPNAKTINSSVEKVYYDIQVVNTNAGVVKTIQHGAMKAVADRTISIA